jgi:hypothetical protein
MIAFLRRGAAPPPTMTLEGALGPNARLDEAAAIPVMAPDALAVLADGRLAISSGATVLALDRWGGQPVVWARFDQPARALATSPSGLVAVGLAAGGLAVLDQSAQPVAWPVPEGLTTVADLRFLSEDKLVVVDHGYSDLTVALAMAPWDDTARGAAMILSRDGTAQVLNPKLRCPIGVCAAADGALLVVEMDTARLSDGAGKVRRAGFPAYLGRLRRRAGGYLLTGLTRRDPLIDFFKTEPDFVAEMKATVDPRHWISPRMTPDFRHDFPIEAGATRLFGEVKPWAPSFSYGLLMWLDDDLMPVGSAHSRANGRRHAISDTVVWQGDILAVSKASGELLNLGPDGAEP